MARVQIHLRSREVFTIIDDRPREQALAEEVARLRAGEPFIVRRSRPVALLQAVDVAQLGARVARARKARRWTQAELARRLGRSESWVSQIERGARSVDRLSVLERLAEVIDVPTTDLVATDDTKSGTPDDVVVIPAGSVFYLKVSEN